MGDNLRCRQASKSGSPTLQVRFHANEADNLTSKGFARLQAWQKADLRRAFEGSMGGGTGVRGGGRAGHMGDKGQ